MNSILFDIGATKIRMAYSVDGEIFEEPKVFETPKDYEEGLKLFIETATELAKGREIKKIAGGMSRSVPGWPNDYEKFKEDLGEKFGSEIFIENDAAIVGLGEANWGAGRGFKIVAYITVSTGVGGVRIVDGKIDDRSIGFEPGKQIIDVDTQKTLEDMISGKALEKRTGKHPKEITDFAVWDEHAKILAVGLNNIIVEWSPDCVVLGGSMITGDPAIPLDKTEQYLKEILKFSPKLPAIKKAELGDFGGLYGALAYLKN
jgi:glucokinase